MLLFGGIVLVYLLGAELLLLLGKEHSTAEWIGYSFLLGIGAETFFMFGMDVLNIRITTLMLLITNGVTISALFIWENQAIAEAVQAIKHKPLQLDWRKVNYVAAFLFGLIAFFFYAIAAKCLFWPPTEHDALSSFDKLGRIIGYEGTLHISLFKYSLQGAAGVYPPLFHTAIAYLYLFGAEMPKLITILFFLSLLTIFYSFVRLYINQMGALLFTLFLMMVPELYAHAALTLGNLPTTTYVGAGSLALFVYLDKKESKYFCLSLLMLAFNVWTRSDTVVFNIAAIGIFFFFTKSDRNWKQIIGYSIGILLPFIVWAMYVKFKINLPQTARFSISDGVSFQRLQLMVQYILAYFFGWSYGNIIGIEIFGITFSICFALILLNVRNIAKDRVFILLYLFTSFILYCLIFLTINEQTQGAPISSLMESSFKRGLFYFLPILIFYAATNASSVALLERLERFRNPVQ